MAPHRGGEPPRRRGVRLGPAISIGTALLIAVAAALAVSGTSATACALDRQRRGRAAAQIAAGRYDARVPDPGLGREFAELAASFNALAQRLERPRPPGGGCSPTSRTRCAPRWRRSMRTWRRSRTASAPATRRPWPCSGQHPATGPARRGHHRGLPRRGGRARRQSPTGRGHGSRPRRRRHRPRPVRRQGGRARGGAGRRGTGRGRSRPDGPGPRQPAGQRPAPHPRRWHA